MVKAGRICHPTVYSPGISGIFAVSLWSSSEGKSSTGKKKKSK